MSNTIRIKRGKSNNLSVSNLQDGELALTLDTNKLYTNKGQISPDNVYVGDTEPTDSNIKCWISPSGKIDLSSLWDQIYPVGSIYLSVNATNPSVLFGGTWEQIKDRFLIGAGDIYTAGKTGGQAIHDHPYKVGYRPYYGGLAGHDKDAIMLYEYRTGSWTYGSKDTGMPETNTINKGFTKSSNATNASKYSVEAHTDGAFNIPPYYAVYIWKRIS